MQWQYTLSLFFSLLAFSNTLAYANPLTGKIERNQLKAPNKTTFNCPQQALYAQEISKQLSGFGLRNALQTSTQNNLLKTSVQKTQLNANAKLINNNIRIARTIQDVLANHDLAIIVDRSGSMSIKDCPNSLSRWQWCNKQASELAQAAAQASSAITVIFFNSQLQVFDNVNPKNLPMLFTSYSPNGGTILATPLIKVLDRYFANRAKPLIIVVISDGIPQDTAVLAPMISDASDSLHYSGEVTISFLLIGSQIEDQQFRHLLGELDSDGIKNGNMVNVISFKTLATKGIKQTLFNELKTITQNTNKSIPSKAEQFAIGQSLPMNKTNNSFPFYSSNALTNPFPQKPMAMIKAK